MVDNTTRQRIVDSTAGAWGSLQSLGVASLYDVFGSTTLSATGGSNWYDATGFYSSPVVNSGREYSYVYGDWKAEIKPRWFERYTGGVKLTEALYKLDGDVLAAGVANLAQKEQRAVDALMRKHGIGYGTASGVGFASMSVLNEQATAGSSIVDPADCNSTPGTPTANGAVNWSEQDRLKEL